METRSEQIEHLRKRLEKIRVGMLSTFDAQLGVIRSRPMTNRHIDEDGTLWFMTSDMTSTATEVDKQHGVNISYVDEDDNIYISVSGVATVTRDPQRIAEYWSVFDKAWFPEGKDDPHITLIRVDVTHAEYWDGPSSKAIALLEMAAAAVTGRQPRDMGDHARLNGL